LTVFKIIDKEPIIEVKDTVKESKFDNDDIEKTSISADDVMALMEADNTIPATDEVKDTGKEVKDTGKEVKDAGKESKFDNDDIEKTSISADNVMAIMETDNTIPATDEVKDTGKESEFNNYGIEKTSISTDDVMAIKETDNSIPATDTKPTT